MNTELDELVIEYLNGNKDAFDEIYQKTYNNVFYTVYLLCKDKTDDYVQDTYIQTIKKLHMYKLGTNFKAWITTIARNLTINGLNRSVETPVDITTSEYLFGTTKPKDERIEKALALFTDDEEREVFIHDIIEGLEIKEIAEVMNSDIQHIYFVRRKMKESLKIIYKNY